MPGRNTITLRLLCLFVALQVFNISMNVSDSLVGKTGPGFQFVNEIETVVEFVAEICLSKKDYIPETQIPGGSLGFEEEEKHCPQNTNYLACHFIPDLVYKKKGFTNSQDFKNHIPDILTPPPQS